MTHDWPVIQGTADLLVRTEKRLTALERRDGAVGSIVSIMGTGQAATAALIGDWNQPLAASNGYYWSRVGALHAPDGVRVWTGSVVARSDNSGMQQVWNTDDLDDVLYYMRTFVDDGTGQGRTFSDWRQFATPTGFIELPNFGETVTDLLDAMAADIDNAAQALLFYEQIGEPVPGVSGVPLEIPVGSVWVDTDDNRHTYSWDGDSWVSIESTLFAGIEAELALQQAAIEAAATAAEDAMDFATSLTVVYRQDSPPSNPDSNGRALVADDVWFDSDDDNRMYQWSGSAWVLLGIATEDYADNAATDAAAIALTFASTLNKTYRASSAPTNPDSNGRALVAQDTWFDTSTALNEMKRWSGSAWVSADVGFTDADLATPTVTGGIIQTIATAARGIKITSTALTAYDSGGTPTLVITAATGGITMTGNISTGGTIDGAVVTGGTFQSEATAARGIKINSAGLIAYNSSGVAQVTITASTGAITLAGAMTGGGTITGPTFQTSASANTGIKISSAGMFGYDGSTAKFSLSASTGVLTSAGNIITAGDISASTVTGGTLQSESTTGRGIKMNSAGLILYAPSPTAASTPIFTLSAATGAITLDGTIGAIGITGATVTGGTLQTTATASRGIKITSTGLIGYADGSGAAAAGTTMFSLLATTGVLTLAGGVLTGGSVTGTTITASSTGVVQTEATAGRGIKINSAGFVAYDATGTPTVAIDAATGAATFKGDITSGSVITGASLVVGTNIRLNPVEGLYVAQPNGGYIQFPADGTDAVVQARLVATDFTLIDDGSFYGTSILNGTFKAAGGVPDPTLAPTLTKTYVIANAAGVSGSFNVSGAVEDSTGAYIITARGQSSPALRLFVTHIDKNTGAAAGTSAVLNDVAGTLFSLTTSLTRIGSSLFGLFLDGTDWKIWKATINSVSSLTYVSTSGSVVTSATAAGGTPVLGTDGTNLLVAYATTAGSGAAFIQPRDPSTFATTGTAKNITLPDLATIHLYYVGISNYDYGASRTLVGYRSSLSSTVGHVATFNSSNVYQSTEHFTPNINITPAGLIWDGTRFYYLEYVASATPRITKLPTGNLTPQTIYGRYTWYDGNATGTTHETAASPATAAYTWAARSYVTITASPAPQAGTSGTDDANLVRMWIGASDTTTKLQTSPAQGVVSQQYESISSAGGNAPTTTTFTGGSFGLGSFESANYTAGATGIGWRLRGDGLADLNPLIFRGRVAPGTLINTAIVSWTEDSDSHSAHSAGSITIPAGQGGMFQISVGWKPNAATAVAMRLFVNGTEVFTGPGNDGTAFAGMAYTVILPLAAADVLTVRPSGNFTSTADVAYNTYCHVLRVRS